MEDWSAPIDLRSRRREAGSNHRASPHARCAGGDTAENSPAENSTAENSTAENSTAENSTAENSPAENSPAENSTAENSTAENSTANHTAEISPVSPAENSIQVSGVEARLCRACSALEWTRHGEPIDAAEAIAGVFGGFDVEGAVDAVGAPARQVLVAKSDSPDGDRFIEWLPERSWWHAMPSLWISRGERVLLLATGEARAAAG